MKWRLKRTSWWLLFFLNGKLNKLKAFALCCFNLPVLGGKQRICKIACADIGSPAPNCLLWMEYTLNILANKKKKQRQENKGKIRKCVQDYKKKFEKIYEKEIFWNGGNKSKLCYFRHSAQMRNNQTAKASLMCSDYTWTGEIIAWLGFGGAKIWCSVF